MTDRSRSSIQIIIFFSLFFSTLSAIGTVGNNGIHDPSNIIFRNGVYHVWGTGDQIYHLTSTDLIRWVSGPTVFPKGTWPGWINQYVSNFAGTFWAPDIIYMNQQYYLYYSCSMGDRPCAIGVATSTDLTTWTDRGMVIYSDFSSTHGSIDPALFKDASGNYWMAFGSHLRGIWITPIDSVSGKRSGTTLINIAGSGSSWSEHEAAYIFHHGDYYYLFFNVGVCCNGLSSTYTVKMGRSKQPTGPYVDKSGVALTSGGGTTIASTNAKYIGPGHFGVYTENNQYILTMHYYDGLNNGYPRLDVARLEFGSDTWPLVNRNLIPNGRYTIKNFRSNMDIEPSGCTGESGQILIQNISDETNNCRYWDISTVGNGYYRIKNARSVLNIQVIEVPSCTYSNQPATNNWNNSDCQKFRIEQHANGNYVFSSLTQSDRVLSLPGATALVMGSQLQWSNYYGYVQDQWMILPASSAVHELAESDPSAFKIFPNPARGGQFSISTNENQSLNGVELRIINQDGQTVYKQTLTGNSPVSIHSGLKSGLYFLSLPLDQRQMVRPLLISQE